MSDERPQLDGEEWRPVDGFPDYEVSSLGRIWRKPRPTAVKRWRHGELKRTKGKAAYQMVSLTKDGKSHVRRVHALVCLAFHGPPPSPDHVVDHIDENPSNNRADNLQWLTPLRNSRKSAAKRNASARIRLRELSELMRSGNYSAVELRGMGYANNELRRVRSKNLAPTVKPAQDRIGNKHSNRTVALAKGMVDCGVQQAAVARYLHLDEGLLSRIVHGESRIEIDAVPPTAEELSAAVGLRGYAGPCRTPLQSPGLAAGFMRLWSERMVVERRKITAGEIAEKADVPPSLPWRFFLTLQATDAQLERIFSVFDVSIETAEKIGRQRLDFEGEAAPGSAILSSANS